jgi:surface protein
MRMIDKAYQGMYPLADKSFIITVKTDNTGVTASDTILLPIQGTSMFIDWGDGSTQITTQSNTPNNTIGGNNVAHTYASAGTYTIRIKNIDRVFFNNGGDRLKLLEISQWGKSAWTNFLGSFFGCSNMDIVATDIPVLNNTVDFFGAFWGCSNLTYNSTINDWDTSTLLSLQNTFRSATLFNQPLSNWNVGNVTNFSAMFESATSFNQPLNNWDVSKATSLSNMFFSATSFNQPLNNWDVLLCSDFSGLFRGASSFNQNLSGWQLRLAGVNMANVFRSTAMSTANYTDTIVGWANYVFDNSTQPINVSMINQSGRTFDTSRSGGANFADAGAARTFLTTATGSGGAGWTISGDTVI